MLRLSYTLAVAALALAAFTLLAPAQQPPVVSMDNTKEVKLTEQLVTSFLAAQKEAAPLQKQAMEASMQQIKDKTAPQSLAPDPKILIAMEAIVKKHGFASAQDYMDTSMTLMPYMMPIMFGQDPKPVKDNSALERSQYEAEIADVAKDATLDDKQKAAVTAELKAKYDSIKPILYPENFDVVMKMKDQIKISFEAAMQQTLEGMSGKKAP